MINNFELECKMRSIHRGIRHVQTLKGIPSHLMGLSEADGAREKECEEGLALAETEA